MCEWKLKLLEQLVEHNEQERIEIAERLVEELKKRYEWKESRHLPDGKWFDLLDYTQLFSHDPDIYYSGGMLSWKNNNFIFRDMSGNDVHYSRITNSEVYHRYIKDVPVREE